jgi:hypothetical protein
MRTPGLSPLREAIRENGRAGACPLPVIRNRPSRRTCRPRPAARGWTRLGWDRAVYRCKLHIEATSCYTACVG